MSPYVSELALYDIAGTPGVAADVSHINHPATVKVGGDQRSRTRASTSFTHRATRKATTTLQQHSRAQTWSSSQPACLASPA